MSQMANQLAQNIQQLKTLIEQAKAHSQASKETAVLHTKIMLDAEKKEVKQRTLAIVTFCNLS